MFVFLFHLFFYFFMFTGCSKTISLQVIWILNSCSQQQRIWTEQGDEKPANNYNLFLFFSLSSSPTQSVTYFNRGSSHSQIGSIVATWSRAEEDSCGSRIQPASPSTCCAGLYARRRRDASFQRLATADGLTLWLLSGHFSPTHQ